MRRLYLGAAAVGLLALLSLSYWLAVTFLAPLIMYFMGAMFSDDIIRVIFLAA